MPRYFYVLLAFIFSTALSFVLLTQTPLPREASFMAGIFLLAAILWATEAIPLFSTALIVIGLQVILFANPGNWLYLGFQNTPGPSFRSILASAADPVVFLFFGGLLMAQAAIKEGVDKKMSSLIIQVFGNKPRQVLLGFILVTALFSMWMSNTASCAMMIALVAPLTAALSDRDPFRKALYLAVPFAANIGGMGTPIGTPPNALAFSYIKQSGHSISFIKWIFIASPIMLILLLACWLLLYFFYRPQEPLSHLAIPRQSMTPRAWYVVTVFSITILLWLTEPLHNLPAPVVVIFPILALAIANIITRAEINKINWSVLILIAGGISLGAGIQVTHLDTIFLEFILAFNNPLTLTACLIAILLITYTLSTFMSNTAAANLLLPIGIAIAPNLPGSSNVLQIALSIAFMSSAAMALPVSTPPNALAYASNAFTTKDMPRVGFIIGALALILILLFLS